MATIICPKCRKALRASDEVSEGKTLVCPGCAARFRAGTTPDRKATNATRASQQTADSDAEQAPPEEAARAERAPKRRKAKQQEGSGNPVRIVFAVSAAVVGLSVVGSVTYWNMRDEGKIEPAATVNSHNSAAAPAAPAAPAVPGPPASPPPAPRPKPSMPDQPKIAPTGGSLANQDLDTRAIAQTKSADVAAKLKNGESVEFNANAASSIVTVSKDESGKVTYKVRRKKPDEP